MLFVHGPDAGKGSPKSSTIVCVQRRSISAKSPHSMRSSDPRAEGLQAGLLVALFRSLALGEIDCFPISIAGGSALQFQ